LRSAHGCYENNVVPWTAEFALALTWLVVGAVDRIDRAVVLADPSLGRTSVASLFYLVPAVTALMASSCSASGSTPSPSSAMTGLRRRGVPGQPAYGFDAVRSAVVDAGMGAIATAVASTAGLLVCQLACAENLNLTVSAAERSVCTASRFPTSG